MLWDFKNERIPDFLMDYYGFSNEIIPEIKDTFSIQGEVNDNAAWDLGLAKGTPICYRAGDQPNNAFSLNVLEPGEIAATAGTSGVVYGIADKSEYDPKSRVNIFGHVNHSQNTPRYGVLLCINGTGILNSWVKHNTCPNLSYDEMNNAAGKISIGSDGLVVIPFGNGAERVIENQNPGCSVANLNFNLHNNNHLLRATHEGIAFSFYYGMKIMNTENKINFKQIRAGKANMFLSPVFRQTLSNITQTPIELYNTDGAIGAARAAGYGNKTYSSFGEAFNSLKKLEIIEPEGNAKNSTENAYKNWETELKKILNK
ncbi:MAG: carbohydrate kinase, partial [Bacteroidales bacterium]|nr:carbohydrate kinase [Bacteroidales bacterium]